MTLPVTWRKHDLGLYCNRSLLHRASPSTQARPEGELRLMHRISIRGPDTPHFFLGPYRAAAAEEEYDEEGPIALAT